MPRGVLFVLIAAVAGGAWSVLVARAARTMDPLLGPAIAEGTGALIALLFIANRLRETTLDYSARGVTLLLFAGVCVFSVDYFNLRAYATRLPVSVGAPIFMGGTIVIATTIGFLLGDEVSPKKILGILLVVSGAVLLVSLPE